MEIEKLVRPYSKDHSIKEVIFTLFFTQLVEDFLPLEKLQEKMSKKGFEKHEPLNVIKYKINSQNPIDIQSEDVGKIGLSWSKKNQDTISLKQSFQIRNLQEQSLISFHELGYVRWANFKQDYLDILQDFCLEDINSELSITALNLTYIDEFIWIGESLPELDKIFKQSSSYLPEYFFNSLFPSIDIAAINEDTSSGYLTERIAIDVQKTSPNSTILITHTVACALAESIPISIFYNDGLNTYLEKTHAFNKKTLKNLLNDDIQFLIKLPKDN